MEFNKLSKNQKGFGSIGFIFIFLAVIVVIVVAGIAIYEHNHHNGYKTLLDADKLYTLSYPASWQASASFDKSPFSTDASILSIDDSTFVPSNASRVYATKIKVFVNTVSSNDTNRVLGYCDGASATTPTSLTINGYPAEHIKNNIGPPEAPANITSDYYAITHHNVTVCFHFIEKLSTNVSTSYGGGKPYNASFNDSYLVPQFDSLAKSIKFLK